MGQNIGRELFELQKLHPYRPAATDSDAIMLLKQNGNN